MTFSNDELEFLISSEVSERLSCHIKHTHTGRTYVAKLASLHWLFREINTNYKNTPAVKFVLITQGQTLCTRSEHTLK